MHRHPRKGFFCLAWSLRQTSSIRNRQRNDLHQISFFILDWKYWRQRWARFYLPAALRSPRTSLNSKPSSHMHPKQVTVESCVRVTIEVELLVPYVSIDGVCWRGWSWKQRWGKGWRRLLREISPERCASLEISNRLHKSSVRSFKTFWQSYLGISSAKKGLSSTIWH